MRRICFVGASSTEGMGDETGLGWPGRLWKLHRGELTEFVSYNLGVRGQTLTQVKKRARAECDARLLQAMGPLILLGTGANDLSRFAAGDYKDQFRTPRNGLARNFRELLTGLQDLAPVLVIGPAPIDESRMPFNLPGQPSFDYRNEDIETGSDLYRDICEELGTPYCDLFRSLKDNPVFARALREGDSLHPTGRGYQLMAEKIEAWGPWRKAISEGWARR